MVKDVFSVYDSMLGANSLVFPRNELEVPGDEHKFSRLLFFVGFVTKSREKAVSKTEGT